MVICFLWGFFFFFNYMKFFVVILGVELGIENLEKFNIFFLFRMYFA